MEMRTEERMLSLLVLKAEVIDGIGSGPVVGAGHSEPAASEEDQ